MALKPSDIQVTLEVKGGLSVSVTMTFRNTSGDKGYIYKMLAPVDGELSQNLFRIRGPAGPVSYKGPVMKLANAATKHRRETRQAQLRGILKVEFEVVGVGEGKAGIVDCELF